MNAIIYCRVSTKDQAELGYSLEAQRRECEIFARKNGYELDRIFIERGGSAKTQNRTELIKLMQYSFENKRNLSAFIVWKLDRLARNLSDQIGLINHFSSLNIRILSVTENNENTAVGKLMRNIIGAFAQYENDDKGERTRQGMQLAVKDGRWCWNAPKGYMFSRDDLNKPILVPTDESVLIKNAFSLAETGLYKQTEIAKKLRRKGFNVSKSLLSRILQNPLYAGLIKVNWFPEYIEAKHEPIVSRGTFSKVQAILNWIRPSITPRLSNEPDFPLRNFVKCTKCGQKITGSWSTGRKKVRYAYYHYRTKGCSLTVPKKTMENKFASLLKSIQPREEILGLFEEIIVDVWKGKQQESLGEKSKLEKKLGELETKRNKIEDLLIDEVFNNDTYRRKVERIEEEIMVVKIELNETSIELNDIESCLNYCKFFLSNCASLWAEGELDLRQRFQNLIFPQGICYDGKAFGTAPLAFIFKYLQQLPIKELHLAPRAGLEPKAGHNSIPTHHTMPCSDSTSITTFLNPQIRNNK